MQTFQKWLKDHKPAIFSAAFGLFVFAVGWCAMLVFWISYDFPQSRGFTYFVSFLFGDSIFLPALTGGLLAYIKFSNLLTTKPITIPQERCAWIVAIISALAGMFIQGSWLLSNETKLNWTIPRLHEFNAAGWWHAGFFTFIFATIGYLSIRFLIARFNNVSDRENTELNKYVPCRFAMYLIWFGASGYIYLRQQEGLNVGFVDWRLLVMIPGFALFGWFVSSILSGRRPTIDDARVALAGALSAYGVAELSVGLLYKTLAAWEIFFALSFALLAIRLVPICKEEISHMRLAETMVGLSAFAVALTYLKMLMSARTFFEMLAFSVLLLLSLLLIADIRTLIGKILLDKVQKDRLKAVCVVVSLILLSMMLLGAALVPGSNISAFTELFLLGILPVGIWTGTLLFRTFARYEEEKKGIVPSSVGKRIAYNRLVLMFMGLAIASILIVGGEALDFFSHVPIWSLLLLFAFSVIHAIMHAIKGRKLYQDEVVEDDRIDRIQPRVAILLSLLAMSYILLFFIVYVLREPLYKSLADVLLLFPIVGTALFITNGIVQNSRLLRGILPSDVKKDRALHIAIAIVFLGCLSVFWIALLPSKLSNDASFSIFSPLLGIGGLYLAACKLPRLAARAVGCPTEGKDIYNAGFAGVKQDTANSFFMIVGAGLFQIHLVEWQIMRNSTPELVIVLLSFAMTASALVIFTLTNNSRHYKVTYINGIFRTAGEQGIDVTDATNALRKHLELQAYLVIMTMFPYSMLFFIPSLVKERFDTDEGISFADIAYRDFLLRLPRFHKHQKSEDIIKHSDS